MRKRLLRMLWVAGMTAGAAAAQNSDIGLLLGVSVTLNQKVGPQGISQSAGGGVQISYAAQLHENRAGQLYLELPLRIGGIASNDLGSNGISQSERDTIFFTPGARWRFTPASRVSFYAALGAGIGSFGRSVRILDANGITTLGSRTTTPAVAFGGGIDFRLTRLLSLRFEGRDNVTRGNIDGAANHTFFMFGVGFHF